MNCANKNLNNELNNAKMDKNLLNNLETKIDNVNNCVECVMSEAEKIKLHCGIFNDFIAKCPENLKEEFNLISENIIKSSNIIYELTKVLELNKLKKIIKTNSGTNIEITESNTINSFESNDLVNSIKQKLNEIEQNDLNIVSANNFDENLLNNELQAQKNIIEKIDFNANLYENKKILSQIILNIFKSNIDLNKIKINADSLEKFILVVSTYYHENYYHNFKHVVMVLQFIHLLIKKMNVKNKLSEYEIFAILIAGLVHDIDHPGHTNSFEVNNQTYLALKYNNISVLENHHCSLAFYLIHSKEIKLLENLDTPEFITVRDIIIECVLGTDMKHHTNMIEELEKRFYSKFDFVNVRDKIFFAKIIVHMADLSNQLRPFEISYKGSMDLRKEYILQAEKEKKLGLNVHDSMKLESDKKFYLSEHYFASNIVMPMWNILVDLFPELDEYYLVLKKNIKIWKNKIDNAN